MTYRTQENPYAQAVAAARQAVEIRDAARELDWQRGRAEAVAALRDFAEVITPALVYLKREDKLNGASADWMPRSGRVSLCVRSPDDRIWVARHLCEIVWDPAAGRWLRIGAPVDEDDGTLAAILMRVVSASDFGDDLAAVTSASKLVPGFQQVQVSDTAPVNRSEPRWYTRPAMLILLVAAALVTSYVVWVSGIGLGLWSGTG